MKRLIFVLAILLSIDVYAQPIYSDYEFAGYTEHEQENDELTKYDSVYLNKFYKIIKTDGEYLEEDESTSDKLRIDTDYQIETVYSKEKNDKYINDYHIKIEGQDNYLTRKVTLSNLNSNISIKEIEVYNLETKLSVTVDSYDELTDGDIYTSTTINGVSIDINLNALCYIDNISLIIYYETENDVTLTFYPVNSSGLHKIREDISLPSDYTKVEISTLKYDKYADFIDDYSFDYETISYYYSYDITKYKYYNLQKEYYIMSELSALDGYEYDPNESIEVYRVYKREYLGERETTDVNTEEVNTSPIEKSKSEVYIPYRVYADRKDDTVADDTSTTEDAEEITECSKESCIVECICETQENTGKSSMDKYDKFIYPILIIIIISMISNTIHSTYVKFKKD